MCFIKRKVWKTNEVFEESEVSCTTCSLQSKGNVPGKDSAFCGPLGCLHKPTCCTYKETRKHSSCLVCRYWSKQGNHNRRMWFQINIRLSYHSLLERKKKARKKKQEFFSTYIRSLVLDRCLS